MSESNVPTLTKPFLKWAGGKRWLVGRNEFCVPKFSGTYFEPFLGGGAVFFSLQPNFSILADLNDRLIETYLAIRDSWQSVWEALEKKQQQHSKEFYYKERVKNYENSSLRAAQFIYLNRSCWNGLYRENLKGEFNVPIGTKSQIIFNDDNFEWISLLLKKTEIICSDFEVVIDRANDGDFVFVDPPYTVAHNLNGFVKYNQKIFSWKDQERLRDCLVRASSRGVTSVVTNAAHESISNLYRGVGEITEVMRHSVISGAKIYRKPTSEIVILVEAS